MCTFLVWEDAFAYYAESFYKGHVHLTNAISDRSVRGVGPPAAPGAGTNPIFVPSTAATPRPFQPVGCILPVTPTRSTHPAGTEVNPIFVPSTAPTPQIRAPPSGVSANKAPPLARPDPNTPEGRRFIAIEAGLAQNKKAAASANPPQPPMMWANPLQPSASANPQPSVSNPKGKFKFIVTNDDDPDPNSIKGYFAVRRNAQAGPSRSG